MFHDPLNRHCEPSKIINNKMIPWQILADGDGNSNKGFKGEWMTVKDRKLYVGGIGMEYVLPNGAIASEGGKFVKIIDHQGLKWIKNQM